MRIMIAGGGTGGHTSPALAIIEELQKRDPRLVLQWIGRRGNIEERVCRHHAIPFRSVPIEGWPRRQRLRKAWAGAKLAFSVLKCMVYVQRFRPQVALGVGGYVSLPALYAAQRLGVPTVLHEQNKRLGLANSILGKSATRILLSFPDTSGTYPKDRASVVGNPVRAGFLHPPDQAEAKARLGLLDDVPVVLVAGGSQGARTLNEAMKAALLRFDRNEVQFIWMTGPADVAEARRVATSAEAFTLTFGFIDDMVTACAAADILVGRAGASSTAEIAMLGKPSILVPYPHATDNHQESNARAFEQAGAAILIRDADLSGERFHAELTSLLADRERREAMGRAATTLARPGAAEAIVEEILALAFRSPE